MGSPEKDNKQTSPLDGRRCEMQQERYQVEANGLEGWPRFLQNKPFHKRESM
jgi:hypothetical protein